MEGYSVKREIFNSLPTIDGRFGELDQEQRNNIVKRIYKNTRAVLRAGVTIPIKDSHEDSDETLKGALTDVFLKKKEDDQGGESYYTIVGEMFLAGGFYDKYDQGYLPDASVELNKSADLRAMNIKKKVGTYIFSVALLGTTTPAQPGLEKIDEPPQPKEMFFEIAPNLSFKTGDQHQVYNIREFSAMEENSESMKEKLLKKIAGMIEEDEEFREMFMKEYGAKYMGDGEKKEEEEKDGDEMEYKKAETSQEFSGNSQEFKALQKRVEAIERKDKELVFSQLVNSQKIEPEKKELFFKAADSMGMDDALAFVGAKDLSIPQGSGVKNQNNQEFKDDQFSAQLRNMGLSEDEIKLAVQKKGQARGK